MQRARSAPEEPYQPAYDIGAHDVAAMFGLIVAGGLLFLLSAVIFVIGLLLCGFGSVAWPLAFGGASICSSLGSVFLLVPTAAIVRFPRASRLLRNDQFALVLLWVVDLTPFFLTLVDFGNNLPAFSGAAIVLSFALTMMLMAKLWPTAEAIFEHHRLDGLLLPTHAHAE